MTLEYDQNERFSALVPILDEYTEWFMQLVRRIMYPQSASGEQIFTKPLSFIDWLEAEENQDIDSDVARRLSELHTELSTQADTLINETLKSQAVPEYKGFHKLMALFEEFSLQVRRLEKDHRSDGAGLDDLTGLRSKSMLEKDYAKEMERVARQGKPFSVALLKINNFDEIKKGADEAIALVSEMIKKSMRSFDDAYRVSSHEFVLSLKQSDMKGGIIALKRINTFLAEEEGANMPVFPEVISCIAEPAPGDNLDELIENLSDELKDYVRDDNMGILEYTEISPLQRFVNKHGD